MKKVIYINGKFLGQSLTGVQRTAHELVNAIDELLDLEIISSSTFEFRLIHPPIKRLDVQYKHIKLVCKGVLKGNLWEQFELPAYTWGHLLVSMCMVSTLFKRKQIVIVHDASCFVNPTFFSYSFRTWYRFAISLLGRTTKCIVTVSDFSKTELIKYARIPAAKIKVVHNAADHIKRFSEPSSNFKVKIEDLKPYVLAVSSLAKNKNFSSLSKAFESITFHGYKVLIAGGVSRTLSVSVEDSSSHYLGYVTDAELKYLYENASLFVFPSFYEGFGIPPLEAMISGCAVLSSNTSAMPEILEENCEYCNPYDIKDIAKKIEGVLCDDQKLESLKEMGLEHAKKFSWQKSGLQLIETIKLYS